MVDKSRVAIKSFVFFLLVPLFALLPCFSNVQDIFLLNYLFNGNTNREAWHGIQLIFAARAANVISESSNSK